MAEYIEREAVLGMLKQECSPMVFAYLADLVNDIPAADVRPVEWIPVTERLPEHSCGESNSVLTVSSLGAMRVLYFDGGNWCYPTGEALTTAGKFPITHWMPLPEPPKEESYGV